MRVGGGAQRLFGRLAQIDRAIWLVFATALSLRLAFVAAGRQIPIYGDMVTFASTALGTGHFFLFGDVHPIVAQLFFRRGPFLPTLYALLFAVFFRNPDSLRSFETVLTTFNWDWFRYPQCFLDAGTCALVTSLGLRWFSRRAALIGGVLAACYPPLVLWVGVPLREVWVGFGLTLIVWLTAQAAQRPAPAGWLAAGVVLGVTGQMVPPLIGLGLVIPWLAAVCYARWKSPSATRPQWLGQLGIVAIGCFVIWGTRWSFEARMLGRVDLAIIGTGGTGGFWRFADTEGWIPDGTKIEEDSLGVFTGAGTAPQVIGGALTALLKSPTQWLGGFLRNLDRIFLYPYNDFQQTFGLGWPGQVRLHWLMMMGALLGLPLAIGRQPEAGPLLLFPLYLGAFFGLDTVQSRYVAPVMPLVGLSAGIGLAEGVTALLRVRPRFGVVLGLAVAVAVAVFLRLPLILAVWPTLAPLAAQGLWVAAVIAIGLWLAWALYRGLALPHGHRTALAAVATAGLVLGGGFIYSTFGEPAWHAWSTRLAGPIAGLQPPPERIQQEIGLRPGGLTGAQLKLIIDMETNDSAGLVVAVNNHVVKPAGQPIPISPEKFGDTFYTLWAQYQGRDLSAYRQWWEIPLPQDILAGENSATIEMWIDPGYPYAWVRLYGDYPSPATEHGLFDGPRITLSAQDNANHRFHWDFSDVRLNGRTRLASLGTASRRFDGGAWQTADLSNTPGRQFGVFRLRLVRYERPQGVSEPDTAPNVLRVY